MYIDPRDMNINDKSFYDRGYADGVKKALKAIESLPTGKSEDICEGHEQAYRVIEKLLEH